MSPKCHDPEPALSELSAFLGNRLARSKSERDLHGGSESHFAAAPPNAVAYPETAEEVARIVRVAAAHGLPLIGYGQGTSLEAQTSAIAGGLTVDFARMARVLAVHAEDMDVVVQPGITREALNRELRATGLFFPVDPGADASLGGMASTRASGTTAVRYGTMRDRVLGLQVVLADGRVIRTGSRARKSAAGYDLTGLFVGAEGTLGLITELTLRLAGQPEAVSSAICGFPAIGPAVEAVMAVIQSGIGVARIEFTDAATARAFNAYAGTGLPEQPHLLLEFHGSPAGVDEDAARTGEIVQGFGGSDFQWSARTEERNALWQLRHNAYYACLRLRPGARAVVTDICVPISRLAEAVEAVTAMVERAGLLGPILGHVGDGNFHAVLLVDPGDADEMARARTCATEMAELALGMGGTITGEHGIGIGKRGLMQAEHGEAWAVMGAVKQALDPQDLMNPGKLVPDPGRNG
ncbi:FAD-binding oxidoreductase [Frigidibacter sp. ROC022]|uniref:FAD-binding oxidoreductase n=1 Tax=Frigidibacter sp. ROC022 TaxID=2971796 RepID=UPI00215B002A|nr:FAD-linked oxidase C-terminal domain-containing protein [Frigidibacter sp. ROC022]MCR8723683.1 FAD-binding protein [Frigidibacter sp. ROC022]